MAVFIGILAACYASKAGFYQTWAMTFNFLIAMYLSIFLGPWVYQFVPGLGTEWMTLVVVMLIIGIGSFVILHLVTYVYFLQQFKIDFPKIVDKLASGLLGFGTGFILWSFVTLLISLTPVRQLGVAEYVGLDGAGAERNIACVVWGCNVIDRFAGKDSAKGVDETIQGLIAAMAEKPKEEREAITEENPDLPDTSDSADKTDGNDATIQIKGAADIILE